MVCTGKGAYREEMNKEIERQIGAIEGLMGKSAASAEFGEWRKQTEETLKVLFGKDCAEVQEFNAIYYTPVFLPAAWATRPLTRRFEAASRKRGYFFSR